MKVNDLEMEKLIGGGITATFLNYLTNAVKTIYSMGQEFGGSLRRIAKGKVCPL